MDTEHQEKCIPQSAQNAKNIVKFHSNHQKTEKSIAKTATRNELVSYTWFFIHFKTFYKERATAQDTQLTD
jgi:hypothetical protein